MGRKYFNFVIFLGAIGLVIGISGCTSPSNTTTYNNSQMSFQYPSSWTILNESTNWVQFKTSKGEVRVWIYSRDSEQLGSFTFSDNETVGDRKYTKMVTGGLTSYGFRGNNSDLFIIASNGNEDGIKQIIETVQFK